MVSAIPRKLGHAVWPSMVTALVLLAVYVSGGRLLLGAASASPGLMRGAMNEVHDGRSIHDDTAQESW